MCKLTKFVWKINNKLMDFLEKCMNFEASEELIEELFYKEMNRRISL